MASQPIYQFYSELNDYEPKIWRRFQVLDNITMARLGYIVMTLYEMQANHLFRIVYKDDTIPCEVVFELPSEDDFEWPDERKWDAAEQKLRSFTKSSPMVFTLQYDYGDGWEVMLRLEEIIEDRELPGKELPRVLEGEGYGIIEDCGGPQGLAHLGEVFKKKSGAEYRDLSDWLGQEDLDLSSFDLEDMNFRLKKLPRIFTDIYERELEPTQQSIDLLERRYKRK